MLKAVIKDQLGKSVWALSAAYLVHDALWRLRLQTGRLDTAGGATHESLDPTASVDYIRGVFDDYKHYGQVSAFAGAAAELGPGDNAGVALMLRADGCSSVDLVDRFYSRRDPAHQQRIYDALARQYPATRIWKEPFDAASIPGVRWQVGRAAEEHFAAAARNADKYDFIVSRSVLEHLYDPLGCLQSMAGALSAGGKMIHKVDLRDHGMFAPTGNPLKFLEVPTFIYRRMTRYSGRPNRILFHQYRRKLEELQSQGLLKFNMLVTRLAGAGDVIPHLAIEDVEEARKQQAIAFVERHRPRFAREFQDVAAIDLAIQGMFIVAAPRLA